MRLLVVVAVFGWVVLAIANWQLRKALRQVVSVMRFQGKVIAKLRANSGDLDV